MTSEDITKKIKQEIDYCEKRELSLNPYFARTQISLLDLIDFYMSSKYRDGDTDIFGQKKVFYNIVTFPVDVASKMIDIDTKDIILIAEDENYDLVWIMQKELNFWLKDKYFSRQLNEFCYYLPRDGHIVAKKVDNDVQRVPLKNLRFRPDAINGLKGIPVIEKHQYQVDEFVAEAKKRGWENWQNINKDKSFTTDFSQNSNKIIVWESYFPKGFLEGKYNYFLVAQDGTILAYMSLEDSPYKDLAWERVEGRTLGRGQVEKMLDEQIYLNRMANYKAEGLYWTSKHIYQTRDTSINTNLLQYTENGDIMIVNSEITPISTEERNLSFYNFEEARWEKNALRKTFTTEPITGERAPSGVPLGSTILQARMTGGYYDVKKENLSSFIKEILWDWVLPEFKNEKRPEHQIILRNLLTAGEDASENFFNLVLNQRMKDLMLKETRYLSPDQWKIRRSIQAELIKKQPLTIPKGIYDNLKYKINIVIEGEEIDVVSKMTTLQTIFQILGSNPTILQDKRVKKIFYKMLNIAGFSPRELELEEVPSVSEAVEQVSAERGGSIAVPNIPAIPTQLQTQTIV